MQMESLWKLISITHELEALPENLQSFLGSIHLTAGQALAKVVQISMHCKLNHHLERPLFVFCTSKTTMTTLLTPRDVTFKSDCNQSITSNWKSTRFHTLEEIWGFVITLFAIIIIFILSKGQFLIWSSSQNSNLCLINYKSNQNQL